MLYQIFSSGLPYKLGNLCTYVRMYTQSGWMGNSLAQCGIVARSYSHEDSLHTLHHLNFDATQNSLQLQEVHSY